MLLALDVGNSNLVAGLVENGKAKAKTRVSTGDLSKKAGAMKALSVFPKEAVTGCILSSVVPAVDENLIAAVRELFGVNTLKLTCDLDTGLTYDVSDPRTIGADLIAGAVGAVKLYGAPAIVFDLGTASTCCLVDGNNVYQGHLIYPGIRTGLTAQAARCAKLPDLDPVPPTSFVGKTTLQAMNSGVLYSNAAMIDGLTQRARKVLGDPDIVPVLTGGLSVLIAPLCKETLHLESDLILVGLEEIYRRNQA